MKLWTAYKLFMKNSFQPMCLANQFKQPCCKSVQVNPTSYQSYQDPIHISKHSVVTSIQVYTSIPSYQDIIPVLPRLQYRLTKTSYIPIPTCLLPTSKLPTIIPYHKASVCYQHPFAISSIYSQSVQIFHISNVHKKMNPTKCVILGGLKPLWLV